MFVAWFEIEQYELPFENEAEKYEFAKKLFANRRNEEIKSDREEPGTYLWRLWEKGATLEAIHWYVSERSKYTNHGDMASEYPSDDIEAFTSEVDCYRKTICTWSTEVFGKEATLHIATDGSTENEGMDIRLCLTLNEE
jgi:hypothetical protein